MMQTFSEQECLKHDTLMINIRNKNFLETTNNLNGNQEKRS